MPTFGADHLSELLGLLATQLASTATGLNVPDRLDPYLQNDYPDAWHESLMVLAPGDDPDAGCHLAFTILPMRSPITGFRPRSGMEIECHPEVQIVFMYRLGTGEDGPNNLRRAARAALDVLRVVCDVGAWMPFTTDGAIEPTERFEPLRSSDTSWLTVRVRFTIQCLSEVL